MIKNIDTYFIDGCGRCKLFATPKCKVKKWTEELDLLRGLILESELSEELKWGMPCYTHNGKNIIMLAAFKEYCEVGFFKGFLMKDEKKLLQSHGENSQSSKGLRFTSVKEISKAKSIIKNYIKEAIELEKSGAKVAFKKITEHKVPSEFQEALKKDKALEKAFKALTPGRQRSYLLHFEQAKQTETRLSRIEKCKKHIFAGIGFHEINKKY